MMEVQYPRVYSSPTEVLLVVSRERSPSAIPAVSMAEQSTGSSSEMSYPALPRLVSQIQRQGLWQTSSFHLPSERQWAQSSPPPSPCPCQSSGWPGFQFLRGEDNSQLGRSEGTESRSGEMGVWIRSLNSRAEGGRQAQKARVYSLEIGLIVCAIHPFPDSFRITEAYPGV